MTKGLGESDYLVAGHGLIRRSMTNTSGTSDYRVAVNGLTRGSKTYPSRRLDYTVAGLCRDSFFMAKSFYASPSCIYATCYICLFLKD